MIRKWIDVETILEDELSTKEIVKFGVIDPHEVVGMVESEWVGEYSGLPCLLVYLRGGETLYIIAILAEFKKAVDKATCINTKLN